MRKDTCIHFNGIQIKKCKADIYYLAIAGSSKNWTNKLPCFKDREFKIVCEERQWPTKEQIEKDELKWQKMWTKIEKVQPLVGEIKKEYKDKDWRGTRDCPVCAGTLHLTHASINGHVWGKCETEDCVSWME